MRNSKNAIPAGRSRMDEPIFAGTFTVISLTVVGMILCVRYDWWSLDRNLENGVKLVLFAVAMAGAVPVALFWLARTVLLVTGRRGFAWPIAAIPAIVTVSAVFMFVPGPDTFNDERANFEKVAQRTVYDPKKITANIKIGRFDVTAIQREDGGVYFYDADSMAGTLAGWVYSPNRRPSYYDFSSLRSIGGDWYEFRASL